LRWAENISGERKKDNRKEKLIAVLKYKSVTQLKHHSSTKAG